MARLTKHVKTLGQDETLYRLVQNESSGEAEGELEALLEEHPENLETERSVLESRGVGQACLPTRRIS